MSSTTIRQRACRLLNETWLGLLLALALGVVATWLLARNLAAGKSLGSQAWFGAFAIAYGVGLEQLVRNLRADG